MKIKHLLLTLLLASTATQGTSVFQALKDKGNASIAIVQANPGRTASIAALATLAVIGYKVYRRRQDDKLIAYIVNKDKQQKTPPITLFSRFYSSSKTTYKKTMNWISKKWNAKPQKGFVSFKTKMIAVVTTIAVLSSFLGFGYWSKYHRRKDALVFPVAQESTEVPLVDPSRDESIIENSSTQSPAFVSVSPASAQTNEVEAPTEHL